MNKVVYKLTDHRHQTRGGMQWAEGVTNTAAITSPGYSVSGLCSPCWIHYYASPELASLLHPAHTSYPARVLWKAVTHGEILEESGLKGGAQGLTTLHMVPLPYFSFEQRISFMLWAIAGTARGGDELRLAECWRFGDFTGATNIARQIFYRETILTPMFCAANVILYLEQERKNEAPGVVGSDGEYNSYFSLGIRQCAHTVTEIFSQYASHAPADLIQSGVEYALTLRHP